MLSCPVKVMLLHKLRKKIFLINIDIEIIATHVANDT